MHPMRATSRRHLAAITLSEHGGGVAQVARGMWDVLCRRWGHDAELITLLDDRCAGRTPPRVGFAARARLGLSLAGAQTARSSAWILFSHLGLARVQAYLPRSIHVPYGVFLHGVEAWRPLRPSERVAMRGAAVRIANSHITANRFTDANPGLGNVDVCPLALPRGASVPGDPHRRAGPPTLLIVGRLDARERYKGHDQLLDAWPGVVAQVPDGRLTVVGEGDDAPRLKAKASALGLDRYVTFTGFLPPDALDTAYRASHAFAMPSRGEGFGLAYIEAMAQALPCIGSTHDAASEVIVDGKTGFLVDQDDLQGLTERIIRLLTDSAMRARMGLEALNTVRERYTFERFASRLESLIDRRLECADRNESAGPHRS